MSIPLDRQCPARRCATRRIAHRPRSRTGPAMANVTSRTRQAWVQLKASTPSLEISLPCSLRPLRRMSPPSVELDPSMLKAGFRLTTSFTRQASKTTLQLTGALEVSSHFHSQRIRWRPPHTATAPARRFLGRTGAAGLPVEPAHSLPGGSRTMSFGAPSHGAGQRPLAMADVVPANDGALERLRVGLAVGGARRCRRRRRRPRSPCGWSPGCCAATWRTPRLW